LQLNEEGMKGISAIVISVFFLSLQSGFGAPPCGQSQFEQDLERVQSAARNVPSVEDIYQALQEKNLEKATIDLRIFDYYFRGVKTFKRPKESEILRLIDALEKLDVSNATAREKALHAFQRAILFGLNSEFYKHLRAQIEPGRISFHALRSVHKIDNTYEDGWIEYGHLLEEFQKKRTLKFFFERTMDVKVENEGRTLLAELENTSKTPRLEQLKSELKLAFK
jgi:hypothetical protein